MEGPVLSFPFLGLDLRALELSDRPELEPFLVAHPHQLSGYTFDCLVVWRQTFRYAWAFAEPGTLIISCLLDPERDLHLMQPLGPVDGPVGERIVAAARELPYPLRIVGVDREFLERNPRFASRFDVTLERENANYVYSADDLARLPGRAFSAKRNHIAQAARAYDWTVETISEATADRGLTVLQEIRAEQEMGQGGTLREELQALEATLRLWGQLRQHGILVCVADRPAGFSIYEPQTPDTAVIHFERALRSYKGLHQVVNREVSQAIVSAGFTFVNREEDLGDEGLRRAKMSYNPVRIVDAFRMTFRG
jgi:uncharacterized protein